MWHVKEGDKIPESQVKPEPAQVPEMKFHPAVEKAFKTLAPGRNQRALGWAGVAAGVVLMARGNGSNLSTVFGAISFVKGLNGLRIGKETLRQEALHNQEETSK